MSINKILTIWENVHVECSNCCHGVVYHYRWQSHWDCCICKWSLHSLQALLSSSFLFQVDGFALPLLVQDKVFPVMGFGFLRFSCMREGPGLFHEWELLPLLCWSIFCFVIDCFGTIIRWEVTIFFLVWISQKLLQFLAVNRVIALKISASSDLMMKEKDERWFSVSDRKSMHWYPHPQFVFSPDWSDETGCWHWWYPFRRFRVLLSAMIFFSCPSLCSVSNPACSFFSITWTC